MYGSGGALYSIAILVMLLAFAHAVSTDDHHVDLASVDDAVVRPQPPSEVDGTDLTGCSSLDVPAAVATGILGAGVRRARSGR